MSTLTSDGRRLVEDLSRNHGFGADAVEHLLGAMIAGHGRMAQFAHPELGGNGQWMSGGMLMLGNMFDNALKPRVGALCDDLARAVGSDAALTVPAQSQSQSQGPHRGGGGDSGSAAPLPDNAFFEGSGAWWPDELGSPSATGSQDSMRYAYFARARRLALEIGGEVRVHDTLDHRIGGFSQQQGGTAGISLSSQHGNVDLASLPLVSGDAVQPGTGTADAPGTGRDGSQADARPETGTTDAGTDAGTDPRAAASAEDPLALIERLGRLREQGLLSDEEFAAKKGELLARL